MTGDEMGRELSTLQADVRNLVKSVDKMEERLGCFEQKVFAKLEDQHKPPCQDVLRLSGQISTHITQGKSIWQTLAIVGGIASGIIAIAATVIATVYVIIK